jgi:signal transduction histidine kinase
MSEGRDPAAEEKKDPLLSLISHEFSSPISAVLGYLRMVLKDPQALSGPHRGMVQNAQQSAEKIAAYVAQLRNLSRLAAGGVSFTRSNIDIGALLETEAASQPPLHDGREISVSFRNEAPEAVVLGDADRLKAAFSALIVAVRRELVTTDELCVSLRRDQSNGRAMLRVTMGGNDRIAELEQASPADLTAFDEFRGGMGFIVPLARHILEAHQAQIWAPATSEPNSQQRAAAIVLFPEA